MRTVRLAVFVVLALSLSAFAQPRPQPKPDHPNTPNGPKPRCCVPMLLDATGKEIGEVIRWDDRMPAWPNYVWVRYELKGGDAVHLLAGADGFQPWTSLGGSAVVFQTIDCSGDAFVNQLTTPTLSKRYGVVLPQGGPGPGPWAVTKAWLYVSDPFPSRVDGQPILWKAQWDFTNQCVPYPAPGLTFGGQQFGFWMKKVEDLYVKFKRPFWIP